MTVRPCLLVAGLVVLSAMSGWSADILLPQAKPVPRAQAVPLPRHEVSLQREGVEVARFYFDPAGFRPFVFPIMGPSGRSLTRMGHPHDPITHSHHNSVWVSHHDVNSVSFWDDRGKGRIVHQRIERLEDSEDEAAVVTSGEWRNDQQAVLLKERRRTAMRLLPQNEWWLLLDLELAAASTNDVTLGKTPFGLVGVRMAKTIGVHDGGGTIRNSEGAVNEKGVLWKAAKWVDYSGAITPTAREGITLMDHPSNPNHPTVFHVRDDGWMGASLSYKGPVVIKAGQPLRLRYGLYVHGGVPEISVLEKQWQAFAETTAPELDAKRP